MNIGEVWVTRPWRETPRQIEIDDLYPILHPEEIEFHFLDSDQRSSCSLFAFLRTYEPA